MFDPRFSAGISSGAKRMTIRERARCKPGDKLSLRRWEGAPYKTKHVNMLEADCREVAPVVITARGPDVLTVYVDGVELTRRETLAFARSDGFADTLAMRNFFATKHGLPFCGDIIKW